MSYLKNELYELVKNDVMFFDFIQEHAVDGLSYQDKDKEWKNPKFWLTLGYENDENLQRKIDFLHPEDLNRFKEIDFNCDLDYPSLAPNLRFMHKNGHTITMRCKLLPVINENGEITRILTGFTIINDPNQPTFKDIKINEQKIKLKKQEDLLEKCNIAAQIGYWEVDLQSQKLFWSKMTKQIHEAPDDYEPNIDTAINLYKEGHNRDLITKSFELAVTKGNQFNLALQIITLKGNPRWVRSIGQTEFLDGVCTRVYGTFQDITTKIETNNVLIQEKEKLLSIIQSTNSGTWEWNIQTGETHHNEHWANIIGYTLAEIEPIDTEKWISLIHPEDIKLSDESMKACFEKRAEYYKSEYRIKHKNGNWIWVLDKGKIISWTDDDKPLMMFGTYTDITEQKKALTRNLLFIEQTPTAIAMFDTHMNYLAVSEKWKEDYGLTNKEVIGKSHYAIFPEIGDEWKQIHQKSLSGMIQKKDEDKFVRIDGSVQWLKWENKPWYNEDGSIGGLIMFTDDITARKKTEEQLLISEEAFRGNFENAAIGMALLDENGKWLKVNQNLCNLIGYTEIELMQLTFQDITHPDDLQADLCLLNALIAGDPKFYHMEKRYICKNGEVINIILAASLVRDENNNPLHFISQIIDITQQKKSEQKLAETLNKIQGILDASTQVSIIETDLLGTITTFNKGAENLLGYSKKEVLNIETPALIHLKEEIVQREQEIFNEFGVPIHGFNIFTYEANKGNFDTREWTYVKKNGTQFPVQLTVTPIKADGLITGYLGIAVDISSLKNAEKEIQSLLQVTKGQNERLKNFAHIVSHNLRSHSGNIAMMLDLLEYEYPDLKENEFILLLDKASNNLKETIEHLNEVVLMNNSINENLQNLNLNDYLQTVLKSVSVITSTSNVTIQNKIDPNIVIQGIPAYLESILLNFITNGIKYSSNERESFIKMYCELEGEFVVLHIEDNGIGIDLKKNRAKIFGMYKTFHNNTDARGIGLFITKNQVEALGGEIKVNSELNKGTQFKIYFKNEKN
tara:strand:+ start:4222 stop:7293 length:3072 start_codon:yes stop_codon:yes gene_type:complete